MRYSALFLLSIISIDVRVIDFRRLMKQFSMSHK